MYLGCEVMTPSFIKEINHKFLVKALVEKKKNDDDDLRERVTTTTKMNTTTTTTTMMTTVMAMRTLTSKKE